MEVCTIIAKNYVAQARVLARSLAEQNPGSRLWTLIIDDFDGYIEPDREPFEVLTPREVGCDPFDFMALRYTVLELSTAVKPWLLRHLMAETGAPITYLDPDIKAYGSLKRLDELAAEHGVVVIPHNKEPLPPDGRKPSQVDVMIAGVYNLGYVSVSDRPEVGRLLDWWADRLRRDCRVDPTWGYFVDQRWFDLVPGFLTDFSIVREPEYNVAYWNLHSRRLEHDGRRYLVDGRALAFFHFSGFDPARPGSLSRHQNRIDVAEEPVLERLLAEYAAEVMAEGHADSSQWPYSYTALGDGTEIDQLVRELYDEFEEGQAGPAAAAAPAASPFTVAGARAFHDWLSEDAPEAPPGVNRVVARLYDERADLQQAFPDLAGSDRPGLLQWAREIGPGEVPLLARLSMSGNGAATGERSAEPARLPAPTQPMPDGPWGVNVAAPFRAADEAGEAGRQLVAMLDQAGIPAAPVRDLTTPIATEPEAFPTLDPAAAPYPVNLLCLGPKALGRLPAVAGQDLFAGRYSIAVWLSDRAPAADELGFVHELWAPSRFVAERLKGQAQVPVTLVSVPVEPAPFVALTRRQAGLPEDAVVFVAGIEDDRHNPGGVIDAFGQAFESDQPAVLVLVCAGDALEASYVERLRSAAAGHPGVRVVGDRQGRSARLALTALADCYVSLHHGEAFGLGIAEAMWLGKPVVVSAQGGCLDFVTDANARLIACEADEGECAADEGACEAHEGEVQPDLAQAAAALREAVEDPLTARARGEQAAADIRRTHSRAAVAAVAARRLESIRSTGQVPRPPRRATRRSATLARVQDAVARGPVAGPRPGPAFRLRQALRGAVLRALRPYSSHAQRIDQIFIEAIDELHGELSGQRGQAGIERAQLLSELRSSRQLRTALEAQGRGVDELRRTVRLQNDRGLYLALAELGRRHASVDAGPGDCGPTLGLSTFELRGYSQNGEDGVLAEILRRVGAPSRWFVEFGVESGVEGNCVYLADVAGWHGLFMEADDAMYRLLERKYAGSGAASGGGRGAVSGAVRGAVRTQRAMVTAENIEQLLAAAEVPEEPDLISIDVDGQDYWIWEAIERYRPRVTVIEYNSALDPRRRLVQPKDTGPWDGTDYFGASLGALRSLAEHKGYRLVHTELAGSNAFFVRDDLTGDRFPQPGEVPVRGVPNYFQTGYRHPRDELDRRYLDLDTGELVGPGSIGPGSIPGL